MFYDVTIVLKRNCQMGVRMAHCDSELSICVCSFYHVVIKSVRNGTVFHLIKKLLGSLLSHVLLFC